VEVSDAFPLGITLSGFDETDELVVVASGYWDDGALHPLFIEITVEWTGTSQMFYLWPYGTGGSIGGGAHVHISWIATVASLGN